MTALDPATSLPLPPDSIQRIIFLSPSVHVYAIPPLTSTKGHNASSWTSPPSHQFPPCRLRILETAIPIQTPPPPSLKATPLSKPSSSRTPPTPTTPSPGDALGGMLGSSTAERLKTDILLEDPASGALFAACPYTAPGAVEQVLDSSRFFAIRVVGEGGRKAMLGIGFEERSEAFDFGVALQEVRKVLGMDVSPGGGAGVGAGKGAVGAGAGVERSRVGDASKGVGSMLEKKRDWSLKEGQSIHIDIGQRKGGGASGSSLANVISSTSGASLVSGKDKEAGEKGGGFGWIEPPSATGVGMGFLPPPPSARDVREEKRRVEEQSLKDLGFDDGEFGEFQ